VNVYDLFAKIAVDSSSYVKGLNDTDSLTASWGGKITGILQNVGEKFLAVGADAVKVGMDFDKGMSQVAATLGKDIDTAELQKLRDFARETAATTQFTASEVSEALNYMALAGYDAAQSMAMLPNVLNLAAAGNMGIAKASDMVTDAQTALGLTFEDTAVMVDQMAKAAASSNTSVEQLGDAILTVGANAKGLKGGTQELITLLGKLADNGIKGSEAGTKLRNMLSALRGNTKDARMMLDEFDISLYDGSGNLRMINDVLEDFDKKMSKMSREEQDNVISTMFNARDMAAARSLIDSASSAYDELTKKVADSSGAAADMARRQLDNLSGDVTIFKSALDNLKISISDLLTPMLRQGVGFGQGLIGELQNFVGAFDANGLQGVATMARLEMEDIRRNLLEPFQGDAPDLWTAAVDFVGGFLSDLTDPKTFAAVNDKFAGFASEIVNGLTSPSALDAFFDPEHGAPKIIANLITNASRMADSFIDLGFDLLTNLFTYMADPKNADTIKNGAQDIIVALGEGFVGTVTNIRNNIADLMSDIAVSMVGEFDADATALDMILKLGAAMGKKIWESTLPGRIGSWISDYEETNRQAAYVNSDAAADYTYKEIQDEP
jgi:TP901 family phage tail tape measure protein